jgi:acyl carrier protein phosphodiesterase
MDLTRMLERCEKDQWAPSDLDWSAPPRAMSAEDEQTIVQLFTDMAGIERLAGALFHEQEKRVADPTLRKIFHSFVGDEVRHAQVAQMLADHYDVRHLRIYRPSRSLDRFVPHFVAAIRRLSDDVANAYITVGELILDIALLRSIDDYVSDPMSAQAMRLINRDESRHIAIDYYMVEHYASPEYAASAREKVARKSVRETAEAWRTFATMLFYAQPFIRDVFIEPMDFVDPSGVRMREAFKRFQQLGAKPGVSDRPFSRFMIALQELYHRPVVGPLFGKAIGRIAGVGERFLPRLNSEAELAVAARKSYEELAQEALAVKQAVV